MIQPPSGSIAVTAANVTATLDTLTRNIPTAAAGQFALRDLRDGHDEPHPERSGGQRVAAGGTGAARGTGTATNGPASCSAPPLDGKNATPPTPLVSPVVGGTYSSGGYAPASGGAGGIRGTQATPGQRGERSLGRERDVQRRRESAGRARPSTETQGPAAAEEPGGAIGLGGGGMAAARTLRSMPGARRCTSRGALAANNGGAGGAGGQAGAPASWSGMNGATGAPSMVSTCSEKVVSGRRYVSDRPPRRVSGGSGGPG